MDIPDGGRRLEVQPDEAAVIRLAYTLLVAEVDTTGETADELNRLGSRPRRSPEWTHRRLRALVVDAHGLSGRWRWRRAGRDGRRPADEIELEIPAILDGYEHELLRMTLAATAIQPSMRQNYLLSERIWSPHGAQCKASRHPAVPAGTAVHTAKPTGRPGPTAASAVDSMPPPSNTPSGKR